MKNKKYIDLIARIKAYLVLSGKNYQDIAKEVGYSLQTLYGFMSMQPRNTSKTLAEKLEEYLKQSGF